MFQMPLMNGPPKAKMRILLRGRPFLAVLMSLAGLTALVDVGDAHAQAPMPVCQNLRYTFQPDCFRAAGSEACVSTREHLDLKPQIAVWLESADKTRFHNIMVTNLVAARGIGNRPGIWNFLSAPKFPYGKRQNALPIWAHARGVLYDAVVMQEDDREDWLGWHELHSTEDPYYCLPLQAQQVAPSSTAEVAVDAITCPTKFNSAKGRIDATSPKVYYPPRNDLTMFGSKDCDEVGGQYPKCAVSAERYRTMNDLDAVATATPPYGSPYTGRWRIPSTLPPGDYVVWLEINKEFDNNAAHSYESFEDPRLVGYGIKGNFGQPSVVYRLPIKIDGTPASAVATKIHGYSADWTGASGTIAPPDSTISETPGSGAGRLRDIPGEAGMGRVHVVIDQCMGGTGGNGGGDGGAPVVCAPLPPPPAVVSGLQLVTTNSTTAELRFEHAATSSGAAVVGYDVRYLAAESMTVAEFAEANRAPNVQPSTPGTMGTIRLSDLKPATAYVVGVKSEGTCGEESDIAFLSFRTPTHVFTQLSGCFIATAAYGSEMEPQVAAMRRLRDSLSRRSGLFSAAADLYYRSGPAAAEVLKSSGTARAVVRQLLAPVSAVASAAAELERR